jgi:hypothetical protein
MTLILDLSPEILNGLTQAAIASGISLEGYAVQVLKVSVPKMYGSARTVEQDRRAWIQQSRESRQAMATRGLALSQTIIELRDGGYYS